MRGEILGERISDGKKSHTQKHSPKRYSCNTKKHPRPICQNPILGYSLKINFFQNKNQKNKIKSWQRGESKPGNQAVILGGNSRPNCTPLCPRMEKNANSRSN